ncbi:hypothetical protein BWI97_07235 [Siphonobacter sp. BAB-5405]|uniref:hypothetical protein n=1 Tax=Siphonobacter sp. BAB-5405 TaxID=1864825 RepID=UPI000C7FE483|nr:hypothetical protein [Siphonobacter sp. BAB-5405]PMD97416.1 hypothetical protein BWI97_07235 [Siphonobacter sp. BAB-5405]
MQEMIGNLVNQAPLIVIVGYFLNEYLKRLNNYIKRTDQLHDRLLELEIRLRVDLDRKRYRDDDDEDDD